MARRKSRSPPNSPKDVRAVALAGIRARHPEYSDREAWYALQRLFLGDDLFGRAWPLAPWLAP